MNCQKCGGTITGDPWLIGVDILDRDHELYGEPLCQTDFDAILAANS